MPGPQPKLHLPFSDWPEVDRQMWSSAVDNDDPFSDEFAGRLAKTTLHKYWMGWRRFLGFLTLMEPAALEVAPFERLSAELVRRFVDHLRLTNTPHSTAIQMNSLYGAARTMMPGVDWSWLRTIKARLYSAAPHGSTVRPVITSVQLVDLGVQLMEESNVTEGSPIAMADAVLYRDGLMIALLAHIPLRHRNFAAIEIGRDLIREEGNWFIVIPPEDTKTKTYIDFQIPEGL